MLKKNLILASMVVLLISGCGGSGGGSVVDDGNKGSYKPPVEDEGEEIEKALNDFRSEDRRCGTENMSAANPVSILSTHHIIASDIVDDLDAGTRSTATDYERHEIELYIRERTHNMYFDPKTVYAYSNTDSNTGNLVDMVKNAENNPVVCKQLMNPDLKFIGWDKSETGTSEFLFLTADDGI